MSPRKEGARTYPSARRTDQIDDYHGHEIADPYRWLEDLDSAETKHWIGEQNSVTEAYLSGVAERDAIREQLTRLWNFEKHGVPFKAGEAYFYFRNSGLENQSVLYTMEAIDAEPRILLDPNTLSDDGTVALTVYKASRDGTLFAYSVSASGSDWQEIRVRNVATGQDLEDRLQWVKFSQIAWRPDGKGIFYSRYDEPRSEATFGGANYYQKLFYHRLGTSQADDVLICDDPEQRERGFVGAVSEDGRYLIVHVWQGTEPKNRVYYRDLEKWPDPEEPHIEKLLDDFDASYEFIGNSGTRFWFLTDRDAPKQRLIEIDIARPERGQWWEIVPEGEATLEAVLVVPGGFLARSLEDAHSRLDYYSLDGQHVRTLTLPGLGTVSEFRGRAHDPEVFYAYTSFTVPPTIYRHLVDSGQTQLFRKPAVPMKFEDYKTRQVFYTARDGTRVPMFLIHRSDLVVDGSRPVLLYGYGGFNISLTPAFAPQRIAWLEMGGVYAVANIRGGGEYGKQWHQAGICRNKQNGIDDFIGAAEWLIENQYTNPQRLAITGGSNGGMLVGASMTQRPDLFAAAVPAVGVMDLLRFHKFTIGWAWTSDYGSPDDPDDFPVLRSCSPYHNIREGTAYPATLVTTGDHDDRVVPSHSFKFAAALQHAQSGNNPTLIRVAVSAGHGAGKPTSKQIDEATDVLAFLKRTVMKK